MGVLPQHTTNMTYRPYRNGLATEKSVTSGKNPVGKHGDRENLSPMGVLKEFSQQSTLHGLRYISRDGANYLDRLCWIIAIVACASVAGVFVNSAWKTFSKSPIMVNVQTTNYPLYKLPFPAVTICPANNVKRRLGEKILATYLNRTLDASLKVDLYHVLSGLSVLQYPFYYRIDEHFNKVPELLPLLNNLTLSTFMLQVLPTCKEFFRACYWLGRIGDCCKMFHIQRTESGFCYSFNSLTSDETRNCSTMDEFLFDDENKKLDRDGRCIPRHNTASGTATGLEVFLSKMDEDDSLGEGQLDPNGARILIHHPMTPPEAGKSLYMPERDKFTFSVKVSPTITVAALEIRTMKMDEKNCIFPDEHESAYFRTYTLQGCLMECRLEWIIKKCGCHPYFFDIERDGVPECNISQFYCLSRENGNIRVYKAPPGVQTLNPGGESATLNCSNCVPTCHDSIFLIDYDTVPNTYAAMMNGSGHLDVYYKDLGAIKYSRESSFTFMQLIVSFGGIMGLFLGISLLSGIEFVYYFLRLMKAVYLHMKGEDPEEAPIRRVPSRYDGKCYDDLPPIHPDRHIFII